MALNRWLRDFRSVDFATSVGLYLLPDRVILVRLRKSLHRIALLRQETYRFAPEQHPSAASALTGRAAGSGEEFGVNASRDFSEPALRQAMLSLAPHYSARRDHFYICLPQEQAVVQEITLPSAAEANLDQVLDYEIERYLPFRREDVFYDYVRTVNRGDKLGVTLFAVPKKKLTPLLDTLASMGIEIRGIETTVTALANLLLFSAGDETDAVAAVGGHGSDLEIVGVQNRLSTWRQVPELLYSFRVPRSRFSESARREILQECIKAAKPIVTWGSGEEALRFAGELDQRDDLVRADHRRFVGGLEIADTAFLPAVGAALRGVREASFHGNVLRAQVEDQQEAGGLAYVNAALAALLFLGMLAWAATYPIKDEMRLRQLQAENLKLAPAVAALREQEEALEKARQAQQFFVDVDRRRGEVLRVLDELSKVVPTSAYLSNLRIRNGSLEIQGSAENASGLIPLLERSPVFENVGFNAPSNRGRDNRETFSLKADLEPGRRKTVEANSR